MMKTRNLWYRPDNAYHRREYHYEGKPLASHRGVVVYRNPAGSLDWTFKGATIAQRAALHKGKPVSERKQLAGVKKAINDFLDGKQPCADAVAKHLRRHGFKPKTYSQFN